MFSSLFKVVALLVFLSSVSFATADGLDKEKNYVCYNKKSKVKVDNQVYAKYEGCKREAQACQISGKRHFGKYPNNYETSQALKRCRQSTPKIKVSTPVNSITKINEQEGDLGIYETFVLKSKTEQCEYTILHKNKIVDTSCLTMKNSKGVQIVCTQTKKICKTTKELFDFSKEEQLTYNDTTTKQQPVSFQKSNTANNLNALLQGMKYSEARQIILNSGWQTNGARWQDIPKSGRVHDMYYTNEWKEIDGCASTGLAPCRFEFKDINNKTLVVITEGECLTNPKEGEKCDLSISSWTFGKSINKKVVPLPQPTQAEKETSWFDDLKNIAQATYNQVANVPPKCSDANVINNVNTLYSQMRARDLANAGLGGMAMASLIPTNLTRVDMPRAVSYDDSIKLRKCRANAIVTVSNRDIVINISYSVQTSEQNPNQFYILLQPGVTDEIAKAIYGYRR